MWVDDLPPNSSWTSLWSGYIRCGSCSGIRTFNDPCPACGVHLSKRELIIRLDDGQEKPIPTAHAGAETRYEDYVYLQLMEREWDRMSRDSSSQEHWRHSGQVSTGASLVLLFWTYFESRLEYLLRDGLRHVPRRSWRTRSIGIILLVHAWIDSTRSHSTQHITQISSL